jgi:hypothetical protein
MGGWGMEVLGGADLVVRDVGLVELVPPPPLVPSHGPQSL